MDEVVLTCRKCGVKFTCTMACSFKEYLKGTCTCTKCDLKYHKVAREEEFDSVLHCMSILCHAYPVNKQYYTRSKGKRIGE